MAKQFANADRTNAIENRVSGLNILQLVIGAMLIVASGFGYELHPSLFAIPAMMGVVLLAAGAKALIPRGDLIHWRSVDSEQPTAD